MTPSHWMYCVSITPLLERAVHDTITVDVLCKYNPTVRDAVHDAITVDVLCKYNPTAREGSTCTPSHWMYCVSITSLLERAVHDAITLDVLCKYNPTL